MNSQACDGVVCNGKDPFTIQQELLNQEGYLNSVACMWVVRAKILQCSVQQGYFQEKVSQWLLNYMSVWCAWHCTNASRGQKERLNNGSSSKQYRNSAQAPLFALHSLLPLPSTCYPSLSCCVDTKLDEQQQIVPRLPTAWNLPFPLPFIFPMASAVALQSTSTGRG